MPPAAIVKELALMKTAFIIAIREWEWCRDNSMCRVSLGKVNNARVRYCDDETLAAIYQTCPMWLQPIVMLHGIPAYAAKRGVLTVGASRSGSESHHS